MMPQPTQETLGCRMYGRRSLRIQTDMNMPTICLHIIHRNPGEIWTSLSGEMLCNFLSLLSW